MSKISKEFVFLVVLALIVLFVLVWVVPLQRTSGAHIVSEVSFSQVGVEKNAQTETIKVHGKVWNEGNTIARNLSATILFADASNTKVVRKKVPLRGDLLPRKEQSMEFDIEYLREISIPKTDVNVTVYFNWVEDGQSKTTETVSSDSESNSQEKGINVTRRLVYKNATIESIEIMVLESFPVQINVNVSGYLPDGCTSISGITEEKIDDTIFIKILTVRPADIACTQAIVPLNEVIALDVYGLKAGNYTVDVNGVIDKFELKVDNILKK